MIIRAMKHPTVLCRAARLAAFALASGSVTLLSAADAEAFCRSTTCDAEVESCRRTDGCPTTGVPLYWPTRCISFGVQADASPLRGIDFDTAEGIISTAILTWTNTICPDGSSPSVEFWNYGPILCDRPEFNQADAPNANVVMFRDDGWPYDATHTLAQTTVTFNTSSGAILDADIEINSADIVITVDSTEVADDLQSILTHEFGHFLGFDHSTVQEATMTANYAHGDISFRTLHADDIDAICTIYPENRDTPECPSTGPRPPHGFSSFCADTFTDGPGGGCQLSRVATGTSGAGTPWMLLGLLALLRRKFRPSF